MWMDISYTWINPAMIFFSYISLMLAIDEFNII